MKAIKIGDRLNGVESNGEVKILLPLTKENIEKLKGKISPEAFINEAIDFFSKRDYLEERLNQMQQEIEYLKGNIKTNAKIQPITTIETKKTEEETTFVTDVNMNTERENTKDNEDENKELLLGMLAAYDED